MESEYRDWRFTSRVILGISLFVSTLNKQVFFIQALLLFSPAFTAPDSIQDPVASFYSTVFKGIAKVVFPHQKLARLSSGQRRIFVEKLSESKAAKTPFFQGFMNSFFCHGLVPFIKKNLPPQELEATAQALTDFLAGHGFETPKIPKLLEGTASPHFSRQKLADQIFDELFQIHHYCLAWEELSGGQDESLEDKAKQSMSQAYADQLSQELKLVALEIEHEKQLYEKDKVETLRAHEQKNKKIVDLEGQEKALEFERLKDKVSHEKALQKLELNKKQEELSHDTTKDRIERTHKEKLAELERKKSELELKAKDIGFFEKTVNKLSDCLSMINSIKNPTRSLDEDTCEDAP